MQIIHTERNSLVTHIFECLSRYLELDLCLAPSSSYLISNIQGNNRPTSLGKLRDKRVTTNDSAFLTIQASTSARFEITMLLTSQEQNRLRLRPVLCNLLIQFLRSRQIANCLNLPFSFSAIRFSCRRAVVNR